MKIGVSGSTGFVGSALVGYLKSCGHEVASIPRSTNSTIVGNEVIMHVGGLAHSKKATSADFQEANFQITKRLVDRAVAAGVRRFVFLSSIAVIAGHDGILSPDMPPKPIGAYGQSKADAERYLADISGIECVILRPPLVYGPGAKGNMAMLRKLALSRLPLPFGSIGNRRTMVSISNLVSAIEYAATKPLPGQIYHVTDARDLSLREIISTIREGAGLKPSLLSVDPNLMASTLRRLGRNGVADQLFGDLVVDGSALIDEGWAAPHAPRRDLLAMGVKKR